MEKKYIGIGKLVKDGRERKHISQEAFAEMLGISATHVKHIESEHRKPSIEVLIAITKILNLSLDEWIFPENIENPVYNEANRLLRNRNDSQLRILIATMEAMEREIK